MKRQIKFIGKRVDNSEWVSGFLVIHGDDHFIFTGSYDNVFSGDSIIPGNKILDWHYFKVIPDSVSETY